MSSFHVILASDYTGLFEGLIWWGINGFYAIMLLITAIGCMGGRYSRATDDLSRSLVMGGIALLFSMALLAWTYLHRSHPEWATVWWYARISIALWVAALLLRRWQRRL
ncbi:hypothetical protein [Prosthecobacter sp.]|uniref:hypothetical protein n=1 Tax=Prosthecobacter sp. TaxID=1965333 RepID=UPI0037845393